MKKFHTVSSIRPHSPKMADPLLLSVLAGGRPIKSTSGVPIIRAYQDTAPWAVGTNCVRDLWGMAKGGQMIVTLHTSPRSGAQHGAMGGWDQLRARLVGDGEGRPDDCDIPHFAPL